MDINENKQYSLEKLHKQAIEKAGLKLSLQKILFCQKNQGFASWIASSSIWAWDPKWGVKAFTDCSGAITGKVF